MTAAHPEDLRRRAARRGTLATVALGAGTLTIVVLMMNIIGGTSAGDFVPGVAGPLIGIAAGACWRNRSSSDLRSASLALALPLGQQRDVWRAVVRQTPAADPFRRYVERDLAIRLARSRKVETVGVPLIAGGFLWAMVALGVPSGALVLSVALVALLVAQLWWSLRLRRHALDYLAITG